MSVESVARALWIPGLLPSSKLLLVGIANHDGDGGAWPSIDTLAGYLGVTDRQVQRVLAKLVAAGLVTVEQNTGGNDRTRNDRRPNLYHLHFPPVENRAHGVTPMSPGNGHGVTSGAPRGDIQRRHGVTPMSPKTSFNRPIERAPDPAPTVDNRHECTDCYGLVETDRPSSWRCRRCQTVVDQRRAARLAEQGATE